MSGAAARGPARSPSGALKPGPRRAEVQGVWTDWRLIRNVAVPVAGALVALAAVLLTARTPDPWPAVVLLALAALAAAVPLPATSLACAVGPLLAGAVAVATTGGAGAATWTSAAALAVAATAVLAARQRGRAREEVVAARQLVDAVSVIDEETGCYNANGLDLLARHVLGVVQRSSAAMHASLIELGDLSGVLAEDEDEATTGAQVVAAVADALRGSIRGADVVGRWSENTFVILGPGTGTTPHELERRLRARILGRGPLSAAQWTSLLTVGAALLEPWDSGGIAELVARAEQDLTMRRALRAPSAVEPVVPPAPAPPTPSSPSPPPVPPGPGSGAEDRPEARS